MQSMTDEHGESENFGTVGEISEHNIIRLSNQEWECIKPHFKKYYIDDGMTLLRVMNKLRDEYGFQASKNQFKKRICLWGLSKNMTTKQKECLIETLSLGQSASQYCKPSRVQMAKVIRHAKGRVKRGELSQKILSVIADQRTRFNRKEATIRHDELAALLEVLTLLARLPTHYLTPCDEIRNTGVLFRALKSLKDSQNEQDNKYSPVRARLEIRSILVRDNHSESGTELEQLLLTLRNILESEWRPDELFFIDTCRHLAELTGLPDQPGVREHLHKLIRIAGGNYFPTSHPMLHLVRALTRLPSNLDRSIAICEFLLEDVVLNTINRGIWYSLSICLFSLYKQAGYHRLGVQASKRLLKRLEYSEVNDRIYESLWLRELWRFCQQDGDLAEAEKILRQKLEIDILIGRWNFVASDVCHLINALNIRDNELIAIWRNAVRAFELTTTQETVFELAERVYWFFVYNIPDDIEGIDYYKIRSLVKEVLGDFWDIEESSEHGYDEVVEEGHGDNDTNYGQADLMEAQTIDLQQESIEVNFETWNDVDLHFDQFEEAMWYQETIQTSPYSQDGSLNVTFEGSFGCIDNIESAPYYS